MTTPDQLKPENRIRHRLLEGKTSSWRRYAMLVIGRPSVWDLFKYELIISLFGPFPGALGLALRKIFYPKLFRQVGSGVIFGRNLVIRHGDRITIGDRTILDDNVLIDARGAGEKGIFIGEEVIVNRDVILLARDGPIKVSAQTNIGSRAVIISTGGIDIGREVSLAGNCKIGGGMTRFGGKGQLVSKENFTRGPILIEDDCIIFASAMVMDGVRIGRGSVIGPGSIVRDNVPDETIVVAHQKLVKLKRDTVSQ